MSNEELYDEIYNNNKYVGAQYSKENASTVALCEFIQQVVKEDQSMRFLDAGCGDGAVIASLMKRFPQSSFAGFDISQPMIDCAKKHLPPAVHLGIGDLLKIGDFTSEKFDVVINVHTFSLFDDFKEPLKQIMTSAKKYVFINSLFSPQDIDIRSIISEPGYPDIPWNTWSIKRFTDFAMSEGALDVEFKPFEMPYELPYVEKGTGSYTQRLLDNRLLTFTGSLYLPWYLVKITLSV